MNDPFAGLDEHVGITRQYWRDIILGVNDGLVSMLLLVAGVVGGGLQASQIILTGIAGAVAGAVSMALGEYLATRSQDQVLQSELRRERAHISRYRPMEERQLVEMLSGMGLAGEDLSRVAAIFSADDDRLFAAMKALEFGVVDSERRSPYRAALMSGLLFLLGSLPPVVPFLFGVPVTEGLTAAAIATGIGLFIVGSVKSRVTGEPAWRAGLENFVVAGAGSVVAFYIGRLVNGLS